MHAAGMRRGGRGIPVAGGGGRGAGRGVALVVGIGGDGGGDGGDDDHDDTDDDTYVTEDATTDEEDAPEAEEGAQEVNNQIFLRFARRPPTFKPGTSLLDFFAQFQHWCGFVDGLNERMKVELLKGRVDATTFSALNTVHLTHPDRPLAFICHETLRNLGVVRGPAAEKASFRQLRQQHDQSLTKFAALLEERAPLAFPMLEPAQQQQRILEVFLDGIAEVNTKIEVNKHAPSSMPKALRLAQRYEDAVSAARSSSSSVPATPLSTLFQPTVTTSSTAVAPVLSASTTSVGAPPAQSSASATSVRAMGGGNNQRFRQARGKRDGNAFGSGDGYGYVNNAFQNSRNTNTYPPRGNENRFAHGGGGGYGQSEQRHKRRNNSIGPSSDPTSSARTRSITTRTSVSKVTASAAMGTATDNAIAQTIAGWMVVTSAPPPVRLPRGHVSRRRHLHSSPPAIRLPRSSKHRWPPVVRAHRHWRSSHRNFATSCRPPATRRCGNKQHFISC